MDSSISIVTTFWQQYLNSEEKFITFYISFSIYASLALYCRFILQQPKAFSDWQEVHHSHNVIGLILAVLSICMDNDDIMKERTIIEFTYGYFLVDCIDVILNRDWPCKLYEYCIVCSVPLVWNCVSCHTQNTAALQYSTSQNAFLALSDFLCLFIEFVSV